MKIKKSCFVKRDNAFKIEEFKNPSTDYSIVYTWIWNDFLNKEEIVRQLDEMQRLKITRTYVLPEPKEFRPIITPTDIGVDYLSDKYMDFYTFYLDEARKRNIKVWLYDEGGWPSGGACGKVTNANPDLHRVIKLVYRRFQ